MSRYKNTKFNFSEMSERLTFQVMNPDGSYTDSITVWAHILKDGFTRSENENFFKIMVREQTALESLLTVGTRLKWKNRTLSIWSWQDPSYEDRGFMEILAKQIITTTNPQSPEFPSDGDFFRDVVSVYSMTKIEVNKFGLTSYEYDYDFTQPTFTGVRCSFSSDRNIYLEDKKKDLEHDSLVVKFNIEAPIKEEDYIISPVHGRFKVDMIIKNNDNMLEAFVQRSDVQ
jgi:head-tail adaptor